MGAYIKIKGNTDFNAGVNEIASGIRNNQIAISFDEDRRALEVKIECTQAISHKVVKLIVNEYEYMLSEYEKLFSEVGFKMYYIIGNIFGTDKNETELESYTFKAYTRSLLSLLAGEHIYTNKMVFVREALQNSIDAIHLRKKIDECFTEHAGKIEISSQEHTRGSYSLSITDNGVGMTKYHIERYLTTIGRSFYKSEEFLNTTKQNTYHPISQFGIGFLSCFNVSRSINVSTKYWDKHIEKNAYFLEVPNIDGCFFIENRSCEAIGTTITLEMSKDIQIDDLKKYIKKTFFDSIYDIFFNGELIVEKNALMKNLNLQTSLYKLNFYISLDEKGDILRSDNNGMNYGIYVFKRDEKLFSKQRFTCLCNGIRIRTFDIPKEFIKLSKNYFDIIFNLPSNLIDLEVSRDAVKNFNLKFNKNLLNKLDSEIEKFMLNKIYNKMPNIILFHINQCATKHSERVLKFDPANKTIISYEKKFARENNMFTLASDFFLSVSEYVKINKFLSEKSLHNLNKFEKRFDKFFLHMHKNDYRIIELFIQKILSPENRKDVKLFNSVNKVHRYEEFLHDFFFKALHRHFLSDFDERLFVKAYMDFAISREEMPQRLLLKITAHFALCLILVKYFLNRNHQGTVSDEILLESLFSSLCSISLLSNTHGAFLEETIIFDKASLDTIAELLHDICKLENVNSEFFREFSQ